MKRFLRSFAIVAFILGTSNPVQAEYSFTFGLTDYPVAAGHKTAVQVFLHETGSSTLAEEGLLSAGISVFFDDPFPSQAARILALSDFEPNPAFDGVTAKELKSATSAGISLFMDLSSPALKSDGSHPHQIYLGKFQFTAGMIPGEVTRIRATDLDAEAINTITGNFSILDHLIQEGEATITVADSAPNTTPEPGSMALLGIGAITLAFRRILRISFRRRLNHA